MGRITTERSRRSALKFGAAAAFAAVAGRAALAIERASRVAAVEGGGSFVVCLGAPLDASDAGLIVARSAGLFERAGLDVELRSLPSDAQAIAAVTAGFGKVGLVAAESFLRARAGGVAVTSFAAGLIESQVRFYALAAAGIRTPLDLVGKRVAYAPGGESATLYEAMLARLAIPRSRLTEIEMDGGPAALVDGVVDLAPLDEAGEWGLIEKGARYTTLNPADFGVHMLGQVYFASEASVRDDRDRLDGFLKSLIAGWERIYDDRVASATEIARTLGQTPERVQASLDRLRQLLRPMAARYGEFEREQWRQTEDLLMARQVLVAPLDLSAAVDFAFLREAYRHSGGVAR